MNKYMVNLRNLLKYSKIAVKSKTWFQQQDMFITFWSI